MIHLLVCGDGNIHCLLSPVVQDRLDPDLVPFENDLGLVLALPREACEAFNELFSNLSERFLILSAAKGSVIEIEMGGDVVGWDKVVLER
jgi:hypothetical protein